MTRSLAQAWRDRFNATVQQPQFAEPLQNAATLRTWTTSLTETVAATCEAQGWSVATKTRSPHFDGINTSEYLNIDAIAFETPDLWAFPIAAIELENQRQRCAYSLWKLLCLRVPLRILFGYSQTQRDRSTLPQDLQHQVLDPIPLDDRPHRLAGETILAIGSLDAIDVFPYSYFKWWKLDTNTTRFTLL
ncbi:hypothetical protein AY599_12435 [Leptolyngbya valderiana BDU 20041]|nr:hypothetical protein AY599_12435 [Leptolyngbya valderiana BDU 20041]